MSCKAVTTSGWTSSAGEVPADRHWGGGCQPHVRPARSTDLHPGAHVAEQLVRHRRIRRCLRARTLEERDGLGGSPLGHVDDADVVQRLDVVGLDFESPPEVPHRRGVVLLVEVDDALRDVDICFRRLGGCRERNGREKDGHCQDHGQSASHSVCISQAAVKVKNQNQSGLGPSAMGLAVGVVATAGICGDAAPKVQTAVPRLCNPLPREGCVAWRRRRSW